MEKEKTYLESVEGQNNLKLTKIKKNKVARSSSSLSDNDNNDREDIISYQRNITQFKILIDHFVKTW